MRLETLSDAIDLQLHAGDGSSSAITTGAALAASTGRTINIEDVGGSEEFDPAPYPGQQALGDDANDYASTDSLLYP